MSGVTIEKDDIPLLLFADNLTICLKKKKPRKLERGWWKIKISKSTTFPYTRNTNFILFFVFSEIPIVKDQGVKISLTTTTRPIKLP